jgi:hypothetical protein
MKSATLPAFRAWAILWILLLSAPLWAADLRSAPGGFQVEHPRATHIDELRVLDPEGHALWIERELPKAERHFVPLPSSVAGPVRVELWVDGEFRSLDHLVEAAPDPVRLGVELPLGSGHVQRGRATAHASLGSRVRLMALVDQIEGDRELMVVGEIDGQRQVLVEAGRPGKGERVIALELVLAPLEADGARMVLKVLEPGADEALAKAVVVLEPRGQGSGLSIADLRLPVDSLGRADPVRPSGVLQLPDHRFRAWRAALGLGGRMEALDGVRGQAAVVVRNEGPIDQTAVVEVALVDPRTDEVPPSFRPRAIHTSAGASGSVAMVRVPAGGEASAVVPLYANRGARPGRLSLRAELHALGEEGRVDGRTTPVRVVRVRSDLATAFTLVFLLAVAGAVCVGSAWRRWSSRTGSLPMESAVFVALMGALMAVYNAGAWLVSSLIFSTLGPLDVFVMGSLGAIVQTLLLVAVVVRVPRFGAVALLLATAAVLRGLVGGSLGPAEILFLASSATFFELCLWLTGATRGRQTAWRLGLGLCVAATLIQLSNLLLFRVLYRLDFAAWYVLACAIVLGLMAPLVGLRLGLRAARTLSEVSP